MGYISFPKIFLKTCDPHIDVYFDKIWYKK